ncbi:MULTISPECIES: hypothetical protein [unclassified Anaerofustis]|uniref:hypothetical protein n=1 Tax=Anaerofustis TaxID=264995 RepID=UPI00209C23F3|nr:MULTISPECIES: hypothetical protein [unclassified Anaerofustis]MCO8193010.1 hypothetical protein [Anaerofustis sp. NSJ-163]
MSYNNFKATVWSANILRDLEKMAVLDKDCCHDFDGDIKQAGKVKILGVARPTIGDYDGSDIHDPEDVKDTSIYLDIDKAKYFNFGVDDIDKAQSRKGLMSSLRAEATAGLTEAYEYDIALEAKNAGKFSASTAVSTEDDMKKLVDKGLVWLRDNGVPMTQRVVIELTPWAYDIFENKIIELKTRNDKLIEEGILGKYKNAYVKMSNNLYNDGKDDYLMIRTNRAIAAGKQIDNVEPFRPEKRFMDAVKGLLVYGTKTVRPKELYTIKAHEAE